MDLNTWQKKIVVDENPQAQPNLGKGGFTISVPQKRLVKINAFYRSLDLIMVVLRPVRFW